MNNQTMEKTDVKVGDGATILMYSDRKACTVISVSKSGKSAKIQEDKAELLNGYDSGEKDALVMTPGGFAGHTSGTQRWKLTPDPNGSIHRMSLRKNGHWMLSGGNTPVDVGVRYHFYDYNF